MTKYNCKTEQFHEYNNNCFRNVCIINLLNVKQMYLEGGLPLIGNLR